MPNWCYTVCKVSGSQEEVQDFASKLKYLEELPESLVKNGFGKTWLGNLVTLFNEDWNEISCRGEWTDVELDDNELTIWMETAWSPPFSLFEMIESKYDTIKIYYLADEWDMNYHITNDSEGKYFTERYFLADNDGSLYHDTLEDLLKDFNSKFDTSFTTYEEVEDFVEKHNEAIYNNKELAKKLVYCEENYIELFKYDICE